MAAPMSHPRHWTNLLRCSVCFSYFHEPVTLFCGHTYCKGCMRRMAETMEENHPDVPEHRLRMWCPTCRHGVPAQMFLRNDANISFVLQDLVEGWRAERSNIATSGQVMVHSRSTQTDNPSRTHHRKPEVVSKDESYLKLRSDIQYLQAAILSGDSDQSCGDTNDNQRVYARNSTSESNLADIQEFDDLNDEPVDDLENEGEGHDAGQPVRVERGRPGWSPTRTLMVIVWATYTIVIMMVAVNFLPYMILYSVLFMVIIYTDRLPNRYEM
ncbi:postreplication repair E3 ubiquitin-protein ligase rad18-like [Haliotis rufescens]|uniref:postreplication repair E3 ubiquitin-protein ligase rad18-like n=1 Tax=Haliotis rufescens TaxID=6454 RepID=UPI001EAF9EAC|nr:postreplication repair E3 ubiquitin-protein ligase rad18-like [Haliotis rufescens]